MAKKTKKKSDASKASRLKGVALAKWMKIDRAQRNMLVAVCCASIILGVTIVGVIYMSKTISFNAKLIDEKSKIIKDYISVQNNLQSLSSTVNGLMTNENLEVVSRSRSVGCLNTDVDDLSMSRSIENVEVARTCTALRVVSDALPSTKNTDATMASLQQLLLWAVPDIEIESMSEANYDYTSSGNDGLDLGSSSDGSSSLNMIGAALSLEGNMDLMRRSLDMIERSVRNYDIASANMEYSDDQISLNAIYRAYYTTDSKIEKKTKKVCADKNSKKCGSSKKK